MAQKIAQSRLIYVKFYYYFICFSDLFNFFVAFVLNFLYFLKNKNVDFFQKYYIIQILGSTQISLIKCKTQ